MTNVKRTIVVDGDYLAFLASSSVDEQTYVYTHVSNGTTFKSSTMIKAKAYCERKKLVYEEFTYTKSRTLCDDYMTKAKYIIIGKINQYLKDCDATDVLLVIGGEGNFRVNLDLFHEYKGCRKDSYRPACLKEVRDYIKSR